MLKFLPLVLGTLRRKPLRSVLTVLSIGVAFLLFGVLESFRYGLTTIVLSLNDNRLITTPAVNQPLPLSHFGELKRVPGVLAAAGVSYIPVAVPPGKTTASALAVDPAGLLDLYPDMKLSSQERARWLNERTAAIAGQSVAARYGWKAGDTVSLPSTIYVKKDGTRNWDVTIVAIIPPTTTGLGRDLYFHHEYFNESTAFGANTLSYIMSRVSDADAAERVRAAIDSHFANSAARTKTVPVSVYIRRGITQLGDVSAVVIAIIVIAFFTMMLITASTMGQSVRERAAELAVLKTLGFTHSAITWLVLSEATLMGVAGALIAGLLLMAIVSAAQQSGQSTLILATGHLLGLGAVLVAVCSAAACALPLVQVWRESIVEGLRHE